jgi:sugar phosphate isomerase/epimerase
MSQEIVDRRSLLRLSAGAFAALGMAGQAFGRRDKPEAKGKPTKFQIACMTLPYAAFPFERALTGLKDAGYRYVALGHSHLESDGKRVAIVAGDAASDKARDVGKRCRDLGLEPVLMFGPSPESVEPFKQRLRQAQAAGIAQVLTMGTTKGNDRKVWVQNFKELGPVARDHGVLIVVKQHGGNTGTGAALSEIVREVADDGVMVSYDAGNVMDYHKIDPQLDIRKCAGEIRGFCIKDHRLFPKDEDCGPGWGEIDHYKLLAPVAFTGHVIPLCCENISAPVIARPTKPEGIDALARRAREFLEVVIEGLQASK